MSRPSPLYGCIEAGGTYFRVAILSDETSIVDSVTIPTTTPVETIGAAIGWLDEALRHRGPLSAVGIATFGPVELDPASPQWGHIVSTPKPGWTGTDLAGVFGRHYALPVGLDTDVGGAALAEARWGAARGHRVAVYVTVGTGIGGGAIIDGRPLRGLTHPEMGHFYPRRHPSDNDFPGVCPFHGNCLEGLASGPAILARWGKPLAELSEDHPAYEIVGWYLAQLAVTVQAILEPGVLIIGGGVGGTPSLLASVRRQADMLAAGYFRGRTADLIRAPELGDRAGLLGAFLLAQQAAGHMPGAAAPV